MQLEVIEKLSDWNALSKKRRTELLSNFSHKKRRAEKAKLKGPAVSHHGKQGLNVLNKHVCFSVAFLNSLSSKGGPNCVKGPTSSPTRKGDPKKQSPRVLQFLIRVTRVLICQTSMCALVLLFWIHYQSKEASNCSEQGSYNFSHKKRRVKEAKPKDPAVFNQGDQGLNVPNKHVCFSVTFLNSWSKKRRIELLWTRVLQFVPQEKEDRRSKAQGSASFWSKEPLSKWAPDMNELVVVVVTSIFTLLLKGTF